MMNETANIYTLYIQVLSEEACMQMELDEEVFSLSLGFQSKMSTIHLKWKEGKVFFDNNWNEFLVAANILVGDLCIFQNTETAATYRLAIVSDKLIRSYGRAEGKLNSTLNLRLCSNLILINYIYISF